MSFPHPKELLRLSENKVTLTFDSEDEAKSFVEWWIDLSRNDQFKDEMLAGEPPRNTSGCVVEV